MTEIDQLKFDEKGLIPAVIVEAGTHRLLVVAYMNRESLKISRKRGKPVFSTRYIRARRSLILPWMP